MRTTTQLLNVLLVALLLSATTSNAQPTNAESRDSLTRANSFEVGTYMGGNRTINLMVAIHQPEGATILIRDADNAILHRQYLKKSRIVYHHKFNFEECKPGVYQVEISNGRQTVIRRVEVVDIPAIESQRYITYSSPTSL